MFQYASTLVNQRLNFAQVFLPMICFYLLLLVSLRLTFSSCVTALSLLGLF